MTALAESRAPARIDFGPWLWSPTVDLALFGGSAVLALGVVAAARALGFSPGPLPEWGWLVFVLAVDVAHVHSTLFRTYLDGGELRRHPVRYAGIPVLVYAAGVALYLAGPMVFWRVLAYLALFHFIRQQVGWVAVYRARAGQRGLLDRVLDDATVYVCTLYPVLDWHTRLSSTRFAWFMPGDFVDLSRLASSWVGPGRLVWLALLVAFALRQLQLALTQSVVHTGKIVVVATTAAIWYVGIVVTNSDFDFTVTNVIVHGVPYFGLLWFYARARRKEAPTRLGSQIVAGGVGAFLGLLLIVAFLEEMAWDRLVWHERVWLFGAGHVDLGAIALALVVPLLTVPQGTHYVLDGLIWRRGDTRTRPSQRAALGFLP
ncbi:MAG: hypothetical protein H6717_07235 [Polyangiaceae bacterium]|nr:hypothetical protein [Polyangiaceae bacterium]